MKKLELIQTHRFLSVLESNMEDTIGVEPPQADTNEAKAAYEEKNVSSTSIHQGKNKHKECLQLLAEAITQEIEDAKQQSTDSVKVEA